VFNRFTGSGACSGPAGEYAAQYPNERTVLLDAAAGEGNQRLDAEAVWAAQLKALSMLDAALPIAAAKRGG
jgi:hypothetical protein